MPGACPRPCGPAARCRHQPSGSDPGGSPGLTLVRLTHDNVMLDAARLQGERLDLSLCDRAVRDATTVLRPDGSLLLTYAPVVLDPGLCAAAFEALKDLHPTSNTRGTAAGGRKRKAPS